MFVVPVWVVVRAFLRSAGLIRRDEKRPA